MRWYRMAAEQGVGLAQFNLGRMYSNGRGVKKDDREAVRWYQLAAEQGDSGSQLILGLAYAMGEGVPKDDLQAYMWLNLAAAQGAENAARGRDLVAGGMTPAQISEAQALSRDWKPKK
jgi:TPR repeat protein